MNGKQVNIRWILLAILLLYVVISSILTARDGGDFDVYLDAAAKLGAGANIYAPPFVKGLQYYYSVFFALILVPFSKHVFLTELFWSLLSYFFLYRSFILIKGYFDFSRLSSKQYRNWVLLTAVLALQFILYNVSMVQVTAFLLWAIFESLDLLQNKRHILSGALLGLAINIKILPVLLFPYLIYRGHWKAFAAAAGTVIALLYVPAIFIGVEFNQFLLSEWWSVINPANKENMFETGIGLHSIVALIPVYLTETAGEMAYKRNVFNLSAQTVELVINASRLFFLAISLFFLRSWPFKKENDSLKRFWEISYFVLLIPLLLPHQQKYAFLLAIPMISYLLYYFIRAYSYPKPRAFYWALGLFFLSSLCFSPLYGSSIIGNFLFRFTQHYRLLTFSTLLLIPIALYCRPDRLKVTNIPNHGNH